MDQKSDIPRPDERSVQEWQELITKYQDILQTKRVQVRLARVYDRRVPQIGVYDVMESSMVTADEAYQRLLRSVEQSVMTVAAQGVTVVQGAYHEPENP